MQALEFTEVGISLRKENVWTASRDLTEDSVWIPYKHADHLADGCTRGALLCWFNRLRQCKVCIALTKPKV